MATSNSYNFTRNRNQLINVAYDILGIRAEGESLTSNQITDASNLLNMFLKTLPANGISLWRYEDLVVFLNNEQQTYSIGATGDHASNSYTKTELAVAGVATDTTIDVDSIVGASSGDFIGVALDNNTIHWTTINGAPSGSTITLTAALPSGAAIDNHVYIYTSKAQRPLRVLDGRIKINGANETPVEPISRQAYFDLPTKGSQGKASQLYYNPTLTNGTLYVWPTSNTVNDTLHLTVQRQIQDLDNGTDNLDCPQEWELGICYSLAMMLITSYGDAIRPDKAQQIIALADRFMEIVEDFDQENVSIRFVPE